jgi:hypothetical protein
MDDNTVAMLAEGNKMSKEKMVELARHNRQVEQMEQEKLQLEKRKEEREGIRLDLDREKFKAMEWKGKSDELDYKMKLVRDYQDLVKSGMTNEQIVTMFPEMEKVIEALSTKNDESD